MKKLFTLIELIVVIAVLGILAAIIIPNISSFQEESNVTAIHSNVRNLQTSIDMYSLDNYGNVPTIDGQPTQLVPKPIDFETIVPKHSRSTPKTEGVNYWVDAWGKVWASSIDAPTGVEYNSSELSWNNVIDADVYQVFKVDKGDFTTSSIENSKKALQVIKEIKNQQGERIGSDVLPELKPNELYLVNAVDNNGFASPPVGVGYTGYLNSKPDAMISIENTGNLDTDSTISWGYNDTDSDGDTIVAKEWKVNGVSVSQPPSQLSEGEHIIELRVKDSKGNWSEWSRESIVVTEANRAPVATINMIPNTNITNETSINWSYSYSDVNNDSIQDVDWKLNGVLKSNPDGVISSIGQHTMQLRIQDTQGAWSNWVSKTFTVSQANRKPTATITMTPSSNITTYTDIDWGYTYNDPDNDTIQNVEWKLDGSLKSNPDGSVSSGSHTMQLRIQDTKGEWSDWVSKSFSVTQPSPSTLLSINYDRNTYGIHDLVSHSYGGEAITIQGTPELAGKTIRITAAGYGTSLDLPYSASFNCCIRTYERNYATKDLRLNSGASTSFRFYYTDSWVHIKSVQILD